MTNTMSMSWKNDQIILSMHDRLSCESVAAYHCDGLPYHQMTISTLKNAQLDSDSEDEDYVPPAITTSACQS